MLLLVVQYVELIVVIQFVKHVIQTKTMKNLEIFVAILMQDLFLMEVEVARRLLVQLDAKLAWILEQILNVLNVILKMISLHLETFAAIA
jgi:hypothetical protein